MIDYILCFLGIIVYFVNRYANKRQKHTPLSVSYWFRDNWPEFTTTVVLNIAIMILLHLPETKGDVQKIFALTPFGSEIMSMIGLPTVCFLSGLGFTSYFYRVFKSKTK